MASSPAAEVVVTAAADRAAQAGHHARADLARTRRAPIALKVAVVVVIAAAMVAAAVVDTAAAAAVIAVAMIAAEVPAVVARAAEADIAAAMVVAAAVGMVAVAAAVGRRAIEVLVQVHLVRRAIVDRVGSDSSNTFNNDALDPSASFFLSLCDCDSRHPLRFPALSRYSADIAMSLARANRTLFKSIHSQQRSILRA